MIYYFVYIRTTQYAIRIEMICYYVYYRMSHVIINWRFISPAYEKFNSAYKMHEQCLCRLTDK